MNDDEIDAIEACFATGDAMAAVPDNTLQLNALRLVDEVRRFRAQPLTVPIESATPLLREMHETIEQQKAEIRRLRDALKELERAEAAYRYAHDHYGDGDIRAGRAWVRMRSAGDAAREALAPEATGEEA